MFKRLYFCSILPRQLCALGALALICLVSCHKSSSSGKTYVATETDAASIITNDLLPAYGGLVSQLNLCLTINKQLSCGVKDTAFNGTNPNTSTVTFNYQLQSHNQVDCTNKSSTITFTGKHTYEGAIFVSNDASVGSIVLTEGVQKNTNNLTLSFKRSGIQRIKSINPHNISSTIELKSSNLVTDKLTCKIISGTANITIYNTNQPSLYTYSGKITFSGNGKAVVLLNSGTSYHISW